MDRLPAAGGDVRLIVDGADELLVVEPKRLRTGLLLFVNLSSSVYLMITKRAGGGEAASGGTCITGGRAYLGVARVWT